MKRYPKYKNSGQSWVGEIPSHWELKPNRSLLRDVGKTVENEGEGILLLSLTQNGLIPRDMENPSGKFPSDFSTYQKVTKGDLVFCLFDVDETPRTVGISNHDGMITGAYTVMRCYDESHAQYLYWFYLSLDEAKRLKPLYRGLRKVVPAETFRRIKSPIPPKVEAQTICDFIEAQVFQMDSAISSQERMIELLKERRSAIITQAVTKGLNPKAKMKESGVPWLGQVPAHWEVGKLSRFASEAGVKNEGMVERNLLSLSYGHIVRKDIEANEGLLPASFEGYQIVEKGDTVLRLTDLQNDQRSLRAGYVNERGIITSAYSNIRPSGVTGRWLFNALRASDLLKVFYSMGGGVRQSLDYDAIKRVLIPVPPEEEQLAIDSYLIAEEQRINTTISSQERMIDLLKERRSAIITQAVTGQIDVR